jgi:hypothetical protein
LNGTESFDRVLLDCVDEALSVLGNEPKQAVYQFLATISSLDREQIPEKVGEFSSGLRKALGGASKVIERLILKKLFQRVGGTFREMPDLEFSDYVMDAKRRFEISMRHIDPADSARSKKGQVPG